MSGGSKNKATPSTSTQQIGADPLSQALAGQLQNAVVGGPTKTQQVGTSTLENAGEAFGLRDDSVAALRDTIAGNFLDPAFLGGQIEAAAAPAIRNFRRSIAPSIASSFALNGRTGSGAERAAFGDATDNLSRNIAEIAAGRISEERGRQVSAAGLLPQLAQTQAGIGQAQIQSGDPVLDRILKAAGVLPGLRTTTTTGGTPGQQATKSGKGAAIGTGLGVGAGALLGGTTGAGLGASVGGTIGGAL